MQWLWLIYACLFLKLVWHICTIPNHMRGVWGSDSELNQEWKCDSQSIWSETLPSFISFASLSLYVSEWQAKFPMMLQTAIHYCTLRFAISWYPDDTSFEFWIPCVGNKVCSRNTIHKSQAFCSFIKKVYSQSHAQFGSLNPSLSHTHITHTL
jgi:hypothetical protein